MALGTKLLIILIAISTAITLSGYNDPQNLTGQFGYDYNYTTDTLTPNENVTKTGVNPGAENPGIIAGIVQFVDRWVNIQGWVTGIFDFVTAPVGALTSCNAPDSLVYLVGGIWGILWVIAIASFIWKTPF